MSESNLKSRRQLLLHEVFHARHFVLVDSGRNSLQFQWQATITQQGDSTQAAFVAPRDSCQGLICFFGPAIEGDFDGKGWPLFEVGGDPIGDQSSVCEQRNQKPFSLGIRIDLSRKSLRANISPPV